MELNITIQFFIRIFLPAVVTGLAGLGLAFSRQNQRRLEVCNVRNGHQSL